MYLPAASFFFKFTEYLVYIFGIYIYSKESKRDPLGCLYDKYYSLNRLLVKNGFRTSQRGVKLVEKPNQLEDKF